MEYGSEEEEISKTIRCILEFIEEKPDLISIWNGPIVTSLSPVISKNFLSFFSVFLKKYYGHNTQEKHECPMRPLSIVALN